MDTQDSHRISPASVGWEQPIRKAPVAQRTEFDPYPGFVFWLFISNMIQILLMPLIMVGQNLQERHSDERAEADYEVNTKAEQEIEAILMHLENQNDMMLEILKRLEKAKD